MPAKVLVRVAAVASSPRLGAGALLEPSLTDAGAAEEAAAAALSSFAALPATGKPPAGQWTVLAAFVAVERDGEGVLTATTLSLGTGSKCVGAARRSPGVDVDNDAHAEALARRALVRWLVEEVVAGVGGRRSGGRWFAVDEADADTTTPPHSRFRRSPTWALHLVVTAPPCGDAALVVGGAATGARRVDFSVDGRRSTTTTTDVADQATGAATGLARRKPGKGPATLSMSCSDKVARWTMLGVQGSLASRLLVAPVYIDAVTVLDGGVACGGGQGAAAPSLPALQRALVDRLAPMSARLLPPFQWHPPRLYVASAGGPALAALHLAPSPASPTPASTAIAWSRLRDAGGNWCTPDVVHGSTGRKGGATKKGAPVAAAVSKVECFRRWGRAMTMAGASLDPGLTYGAAKREAVGYAAAWAALRAPPSPLAAWLAKPEDGDEFGLEMDDRG